MPRGVYDRSHLRKKATNLEASYSIAEKTAEFSVRWTPEEIKRIAVQWVLERLDAPFEAVTRLAERAQRKALTPERQRDIASMAANPPLARAIGQAWREFLERPALPQGIPTPVAALPQVVTIEVPRKLTAEEMLCLLDEPALTALLAAKRLQRESEFQESLRALATQAGANIGKGKPYVPNFEVFEPAAGKTPRIAVVGLNEEAQGLLAGEVKAALLKVNLSFPDGKDTTVINRCDYAVICRNGHLDGSDSDRAIGALGRSRVALVAGHGIADVMQQLRNFASRQ